MARPVWETVLTYSIAARLGLGGVPSKWAYNAAALVVRALDRAYNLGAGFSPLGIASPADLGDDDVFPPDNPARRVLEAFWLRIGWPGYPRGEARRLLLLARESLQTGGRIEAVAAAAVAAEAEALAAREGYAEIGPKWGEVGWDEEGVDGLGGLREEFLEWNPEAVATFDRYAADSSLWIPLVRKFQTEAADQGLYSLRVDGAWGRGSEAAWRTMSGSTGEHRSTLTEAATVSDATGGRLTGDEAVVVAIARDAWLEGQGVPASPFPLPPESGPADDSSVQDVWNLIAVSSPKPPDLVPMGLPGGAASGGGTSSVDIRQAPDMVTVRPVSGGGSRNWPLWTLLGLVLVGGVVAVRSRRAT